MGIGPAGGNYSDALQAAPAGFEPARLQDDHPSFQPYTSGSTGRPKGVVLTHAGQCWWIRCLQKYWPGQPENRALAAVPLYHKNAMAGAIKPMLSWGGSVVLLPNFEPRRFLRALSEYRCTHAGAVPAVFTLLLQERDLIETLDFSALKSFKIGSAPTPKELLDAVEAAFGVAASESYGLTEGGPVMIGTPIDGRMPPHGSCGIAWPEGEVKLVDADGMEDPQYGELWVRNPGVDARLLEAAGGEPGTPQGRLAEHRRHFLEGRRRVFLFPRPDRRHVQFGRREHLSPRDREHAAAQSRGSGGLGGADSRIASRARSPWRWWSRRRAARSPRKS